MPVERAQFTCSQQSSGDGSSADAVWQRGGGGGVVEARSSWSGDGGGSRDGGGGGGGGGGGESRLEVAMIRLASTGAETAGGDDGASSSDAASVDVLSASSLSQPRARRRTTSRGAPNSRDSSAIASATATRSVRFFCSAIVTQTQRLQRQEEERSAVKGRVNTNHAAPSPGVGGPAAGRRV
jgi:hypothetical protein